MGECRECRGRGVVRMARLRPLQLGYFRVDGAVPVVDDVSFDELDMACRCVKEAVFKLIERGFESHDYVSESICHAIASIVGGRY